MIFPLQWRRGPGWVGCMEMGGVGVLFFLIGKRRGIGVGGVGRR